MKITKRDMSITIATAKWKGSKVNNTYVCFQNDIKHLSKRPVKALQPLYNLALEILK